MAQTMKIEKHAKNFLRTLDIYEGMFYNSGVGN